MLKRLVAVILALVIVLGVMEKPAYADSGNTLLMDLEATNTASLYVMSLPNSDSRVAKFVTWAAKQAGGGLIGFVAVTGVCIAADTAATTVFPPAAALLPYCPAIGGAFGGGVAVGETALTGVGVKAVTELAK